MIRFPVSHVQDRGAQQNFESLTDVLEILQSATFDTGDLRPTARASAPDGWLLCDGSAVSRSTYADLFDAIGTTFGSGDGSTTFNVPDLQGRAPIGAGSGSGLTTRALGDKVGTETHQLTVAQMPNHTHTESRPVVINQGQPGNAINAGAIGSFNTGGAGGDQAHPNMQPSLAINWLIRA